MGRTASFSSSSFPWERGSRPAVRLWLSSIVTLVGFAFHSGVYHCLRFLVLGTGRGLRVTHSGCHLPYGRGGGSPLPGPWQHTLESSWPHRTRGRGTHRGRQRGERQAGAEELGALWRQPGALGDFSSETDDLLLFEFGVEPLAVPH